jgi:dTDP-4-dehydrorhamnose 3,5-epimerase
VFTYKCDNFYCKEAEGGLCVNDPALGIDWQIDMSKANVLERDLNHPLLKDLEPCF